MTCEITKRITYDITKICFGDTVHLAFTRREVVGFQSWKQAGVFSIEITFRDGAKITTEYDEREKWERVLKLLEYDVTL